MKKSLNIPVYRTEKSRADHFNFEKFTFGADATDHMFVVHYKDGAWRNPRVEPFQNLSLSPFSLCLHYGQTVFEGMKAFKTQDGKINIFRPEKNFARINKSLERMCMPQISEELFFGGLDTLISTDQNWVSDLPGNALYIRPFAIATESQLGVHVANEYLFIIACCPIAQYYNKPLKVKVETHYVRAAEGGTGYAKCGGNYGASFFPFEKAKQEGFDQIIWTDAKNHEFIEESGTMNIGFFIDGTFITPATGDTILDGVTRDTLVNIARDLGFPVEERKISHKELQSAFESGKKVEAFGIGTAAIIAPFELIDIEGKQFAPYAKEDAQMFQLKQKLDDIRYGNAPDTHAWNYEVKLTENALAE